MKSGRILLDAIVSMMSEDSLLRNNTDRFVKAFAIDEPSGAIPLAAVQKFFRQGRDAVLEHIRKYRPGMEEVLRYVFRENRRSFSTAALAEEFSLEVDEKQHVPPMLYFLCENGRYYSYYYRSSESILSSWDLYVPVSFFYYLRYLFGDYETPPEASLGEYRVTYVYNEGEELASFIRSFFRKNGYDPDMRCYLNSRSELLAKFEKELALPSSPFWKPYRVSAAALALYFAMMAKYSYFEYRDRDILEMWSDEEPPVVDGEADVVLRNLKVRRTGSYYESDSFTVSHLERKLFIALLRDLPNPDAWYLIDELKRVYELSGFRYSAPLAPYFDSGALDSNVLIFTTADGKMESRLSYKYDFEWKRVMDRNLGLFYSDGSFRGLFYMLALFDIVELYEEECEEKVELTSGRQAPYTPYSAAKAMRLTPYGKWLFGYTEKLEKKSSSYEVMADDDLLIITFRGINLQVSALLGKLAIPVGPMRYKVTKASFLKDINDLAGFRRREKAFRALFSAPLPPNWDKFLSELEKLFRQTALYDDAYIVTLPDPELAKPFLNDKTFRSLFILAEGGKLIISKDDLMKAAAFLHDNGIANTEWVYDD